MMKIGDWLGADNQLGIDIWTKKYCYDGESFEQWLDRVSGKDESVKQLIKDKKFLFGGRILANRGLYKNGLKVTYSNCYVVSPPEDSIESIFEAASKTARTFSYGGGVGIDLSKLAPRGAKINNTAEETSGAVSFSDLYSDITGLIGQHGRRGALMLTLSCTHPDLEEFMSVKTDVERVTKANMSIRMSDEFMRCVRDHKMFTQSFSRPETGEEVIKEIDAHEFFKKMCYANWDYGEPGCLFWDRISSWNLLSEYPNYEYTGTNPCAEEPLPAGGSCLLGSMNLSEFVKEDGSFDIDGFKEAVKVCVKALNDVLDEGLPLHPLQEQKDSVSDWRQIGLGIMGLADMFIKMGITYGSREAVDVCHEIGFTMADCAIASSSQLAKIDGAFPMYDRDNLLSSPYFIANTSEETREIVKANGLRNSQILTIAPTGSISTMLGISGGIEPIFATHFIRKTVSLSNREESYKVYPPIVKNYMDEHGLTDDAQLPEFFVTAQDIDYMSRIVQQSVWQKHIDASISSTVNLPEDFPEEKVYDLYMSAWQKGCKGITVFRDGCKRQGILTPKSDGEERGGVEPSKEDKPSGRGIVREVTPNVIGKKRKLVTGCGNLHCTAFFDPETGDLMEVFLNKGSTGGCNNFMIGLSRMISLAARTGSSVETIVDQLKSCGSCPSYTVRTFTKKDTCKGSCCPTAVGWALLEMSKEMKEQIKQSSLVTMDKEPKTPKEVKNPCPNCGDELMFQGGCNICKSCGWTKCE